MLTPAPLHGPVSDSLHSTSYEISASAAFRRGQVNSRLLPFFTTSPGCSFSVHGPLPVRVRHFLENLLHFETRFSEVERP